MDAVNTVFQGISVLSGGVSGWSKYRAGKAEEGAYKYNAEVALAKAKHEEEQSRTRYQELKGKQAALYAKAGVDLTSGSPLLIMADTAYQEEEEAKYIRAGGTNEALALRYSGKIAAYTEEIGGWSTFLTGLGKTSLEYAQRKAPSYGIPVSSKTGLGIY